MDIWQMNAWELIKAGGPLMAPILLCSVLASAIIIEKLWTLAAIKTDTEKLKSDIFEHIKSNKITEALSLCDSDPSPVAKVLKAGIMEFGSSREEIKESIRDASLLEIPKLEEKLGALATVANVAPLLGLLGTVLGIAQSFYTLQVRSASLAPITPSDLAGGIWQALITTIAGLLIAIPTFIAYNFCVSRVNNIILGMESAAAQLVNFMGHIAETDAAKKERQSIEI